MTELVWSPQRSLGAGEAYTSLGFFFNSCTLPVSVQLTLNTALAWAGGPQGTVTGLDSRNLPTPSASLPYLGFSFLPKLGLRMERSDSPNPFPLSLLALERDGGTSLKGTGKKAFGCAASTGMLQTKEQPQTGYKAARSFGTRRTWFKSFLLLSLSRTEVSKLFR